MRTIYKPVRTVGGRVVVTKESDCYIARRERLQGKRVHRAVTFEVGFYKAPGKAPEYICSRTGFRVHLQHS